VEKKRPKGRTRGEGSIDPDSAVVQLSRVSGALNDLFRHEFDVHKAAMMISGSGRSPSVCSA